MKRDHARSLLEQGLAELANARRHLDYSFQQVAGLPDALKGATEKQLESAEAFTGRFARSVDLLVNKVLRSLDRVELKPEGTLLDVVNRAEKRGFVNRSEELREMKDVRNMIAAPPRRHMEPISGSYAPEGAPPRRHMEPISGSYAPEGAPPRRHMEFVVYAIKSRDTGRIYIGQTADFAARLLQHNGGQVKSTKSGRPWFLVASKSFPNRSLARWQEHTLKRSLGARTRWIVKHATI